MKKIMLLLNTLYLICMTGINKTFAHNDDELSEMLSNMSGNGFESNFENLGGRAALNLSDAEMKVAQKIAPTVAAAVHKHVGKGMRQGNLKVQVYGQAANPETVAQLERESKGDLNLTVIRNSANLLDINGNPVILPFVLFGSQDYTAGYASTLTPYIPAGLTFSISKDSLGNVIFTYIRVSDSATDTITIYNLGNLNYASFLASQNQNYFATEYMKFFLPNDAQIPIQFAQPVLYGKLSALGAKNFNQLICRSRIHSWQYLAYILEVLMPEQTIVPDFGFILYMTGGARYSIGLDMFMSKRGNLNDMHKVIG